MRKLKVIGKEYKQKHNIIAKIIKYEGVDNVTVLTNNGTKILTNMRALKNGSVIDVLSKRYCGIGYIGEGKYNINHKSFSRWIKIINRCYNEQYKTHTYIGCTVDKEWHNFQNFANWYEKNYIEYYDIDKDIKFPENKIYSKNTCMFVHKDVNKFFKKHSDKNSLLPHGIFECSTKYTTGNNKKILNSIDEALCDYWNNKYTEMEKLCARFPTISCYIRNKFENFFSKNFPVIKNNIVFDLEGTITNCKHRMNLKKNKLKFQTEIVNDSVNDNIALFMSQLKNKGYKITILTSKIKYYRKIVVEWLYANNIQYDDLIMRESEKETGYDFKVRYARINEKYTLMAFDDVGKIAKGFCDNGIPCLRIVQNEAV